MSKFKRSINLFGTLVLFVTPLAQVQSVLATSNDGLEFSNKSEIEKNLRSLTDEQQTKSTSAFYDAVKAQLSAKGADVSSWSTKKLDSQPVRIIVQLSADPAVDSTVRSTGSQEAVKTIDSASKNVIDQQSSIKNKVETITGNKIKQSYGYLINGFSIDAKPSQISDIRKISGVKDVTVAKVYKPMDISANQLANVNKVWTDNKLKGEGLVISIIDSGIDPTHKDLRVSDPSKDKISLAQGNADAKSLGYGKAFTDKVPFAYNYADNNSDVVWDTGNTMHGMHVAGIAAANGTGTDPKILVQGVAPEAQLLDMKVFSNPDNAGAVSDDVIKAIEDSVKLGADVINMSLGSTSADVDANDPEQAAVSKAAAQGVIPVIAAGNSGLSNSTTGTDVPFYNTNDEGTVGSPGVVSDAITVASSENSTMMANAIAITDSNGKKLIDKSLFGQVSNVKSFTEASGHGFYIAKNGKDGLPGIGEASDFDDNAKGKIAVVARGQITFKEKQENAKAAGAVGILIIDNNPDDTTQGFSWNEDFPSLGVTTSDGKELLNAINNNPATDTYTISTESVSVPNGDAGKMSSFSSFGPTPDLSFKPDITAPGGNIWSLANNNKYQSMSGTSMATPFMSGSTAILVESLKQNGINLTKSDLTKFAKTDLMNTAKTMLDVDNKGNIISPRQQGSGLIQLDKAVNNRVTATDPAGNSSFALKEIGQNVDMNVTLTNHSDKDVKYTFNDHGGPWTSADTLNTKVHEVPIAKGALTTDSNSITVPANGKTTVTIHLTLPMDFPQQKFVEGYLGFDSEAAPSLVIPYLGFHGKWSEGKVLDNVAWDKDSIFGSGYFKDSEDNILGSDLTGSDLDSQKKAKDFSSDSDKYLSYIKPETVAISPNGDKHQDYAYPTFYLYRNAKNPKAEILDDKGNVIKTIYNDTAVSKSFYDSTTSAMTSLSGDTLAWDGTAWDSAEGKNKVVPDGVYTYRLTVTPEGNDPKEQSISVPIRVDTKSPKLDDFSLTKEGDDYYLSVKATDSNSGIHNMGVMNITINGVSHDYDLYDDKGNDISTDPVKFKLSKDQVAALQNGKNLIEAGVLDNASNYGYKEELVTVPGKSDKGLVLFNLADGMHISSTNPYLDKSKTNFEVDGSSDQDVYVNGKLARLAPDGTFKVDVSLPSDGVFNISTDKAGKNVLQTVKTVLAFTGGTVKVDKDTDTTDQDKYEIKGTVSTGTKKLELKPEKGDVVDITKDIKDNSFSHSVDLKFGENKFTLTATDEDGNESTPVTVTINCTNDSNSEDQISFDDLDGIGSSKLVNATTKNYDATSGTFTINGTLKQPVSTFKIDGKEIPYDKQTLKFSTTVKIPANGYQSYSVYLQDNKLNGGKALVDSSIHFQIDTTLPTLKLDNEKDWQVDNDGNYHISTMKQPFTISGTASDNLSGFGVFIDNDSVAVTPDYSVFNAQTGVPITFTKDLNLVPGLNKHEITVFDITGNKVSKKLFITYKGV